MSLPIAYYYSLIFFLRTVTCELKALGKDYCYKGCDVQFKNKASCVFSFYSEAALKVKCKDNIVTSLARYYFSNNIKLQTPAIPSVARGNLSWSLGANVPTRLLEFLFQLQFKKANEPWEGVPLRGVNGLHSSGSMNISSHVQVGVRYQARVRVRPHNRDSTSDYAYGAVWSDWSPVLTWTSDVGDLPPTTPSPGALTLHLEIGLLSGGLCVCLAIVVMVCLITKAQNISHCCSCKMKSQHVPDPSRYFQPLHSLHGGDFQSWLSPTSGPAPFADPQPSDRISRVEVSPILDTEVCQAQECLQHPPQGKSRDVWSSSGQSSCYSNMGYFYSEFQPGRVHIESCPIYFTYPSGGQESMPVSDTSGTSTASYERLEQVQQLHSLGNMQRFDQQGEPPSPDSGFGVEVCDGEPPLVNEGEGVVEENEWRCKRKETTSIICLQSQAVPNDIHTLSSVPMHPPELIECIKTREDAAPPPACNQSSLPAEGSLPRSASMIVQPCSSGYLTIKEMLSTYSNKSI
ncbi:hypothetical protein ACEWY4_003619 [Coilia grayii]|uniref:Uncharacterized protein n=1 Tax=Coilia grayii TaxID=363190 RepID=A0ABD1KRU1_9TELE